ncbi:hypothetical protein V8E36_001676 [Tilletia maclaganii]
MLFTNLLILLSLSCALAFHGERDTKNQISIRSDGLFGDDTFAPLHHAVKKMPLTIAHPPSVQMKVKAALRSAHADFASDGAHVRRLLRPHSHPSAADKALVVRTFETHATHYTKRFRSLTDELKRPHARGFYHSIQARQGLPIPSLGQLLVSALQGLFTAITDLVQGAVEGLRAVLTGLVTALRDLLTGLAGGDGASGAGMGDRNSTGTTNSTLPLPGTNSSSPVAGGSGDRNITSPAPLPGTNNTSPPASGDNDTSPLPGTNSSSPVAGGSGDRNITSPCPLPGPNNTSPASSIPISGTSPLPITNTSASTNSSTPTTDASADKNATGLIAVPPVDAPLPSSPLPIDPGTNF